MHVVNSSEIMLDNSLLNNSIQAVSLNSKQLLISAFRPTPDDEVELDSIFSCRATQIIVNIQSLRTLRCFSVTVTSLWRKAKISKTWETVATATTRLAAPMN